MKGSADYTLYVVTDRSFLHGVSLERAVEQAIAGGATMVQLREKELDSRDFYETALVLKKVCRALTVPLIINDRADIAMAIDADGVHVGQGDLPAACVRAMIGEGKLLGVSASTLGEAQKAREDGADYIGVGAMFQTATKEDAALVSLEELERICDEVSLPVVAIGGINMETLPLIGGKGIDGIAVVSAVWGAPDIKAASFALKTEFRAGQGRF